MLKITEDPRPIEALYWNDVDGNSLRIGRKGVTKIEAYGESGMHCDLPWLAVFKGDEIFSRVPAYQVEIHYQKPNADPVL